MAIAAGTMRNKTQARDDIISGRHRMRLTFIGADHEVTGSCHYLEAAGKRFLLTTAWSRERIHLKIHLFR